MRFGLQVIADIPGEQMLALMREGEELGYDTVWCPDSHLIWREAFAALGAATQVTRATALGTAVTNVETRHLTVVASAMATLQELSGGRMICGIGLGDSAVETLGLHRTRRRDLEEAVGRLRRLWAGEEVELGDGTGGRLTWCRDVRIPVYYGASGPRMLDDAGRLADGVITLVGADPVRVGAALERFRASARAAGRDPDDLEEVVWLACSVADDPHEAVDAVRSHAARAITHALPHPLDEEESRVAEEVRRTYDYYEHVGDRPAHASAMPEEIVRRFAVAGTPDDCVSQLEALRDVGVRRVGALPMGADRSAVSRRFVTEVAARFMDPAA